MSRQIMVPDWAFDELMALRAKLMADASEAQDYIREGQLKGDIRDPFARGAVIGIACKLAQKRLK